MLSNVIFEGLLGEKGGREKFLRLSLGHQDQTRESLRLPEGLAGAG